MQSGDLLVEAFWQQVNVVLVTLAVLPIIQQIQLAEHLIREGARHHERWVSSGTSEIQQPTRGKDYDSMAIREYKTINLGLDVLHLNARETLELGHLNLIVEVTNVTNNGIVLHFLHVLQGDNLEITRRCHENVHLA